MPEEQQDPQSGVLRIIDMPSNSIEACRVGLVSAAIELTRIIARQEADAGDPRLQNALRARNLVPVYEVALSLEFGPVVTMRGELRNRKTRAVERVVFDYTAEPRPEN